MHGHPVQGVKNAKPRLSSRPGPKIGKLSEEYLTIRSRQMSVKAMTAEMIFAQQRGELRSPTDGRNYRLALTLKGQRVWQQVSKLASAHEEEICAPLELMNAKSS